MVISYFYLYLLIISTLVGYLLGFIFMLREYEEPVYSETSRKRKDTHPKKEAESDSVPDVPVRNSLASRFTDQGTAYVDVVCDSENIDETNYIEKHRRKQTRAYNYTKRKKNWK